MRVGDAEQLEHALDAPSSPKRPCSALKTTSGARVERAQQRRDVAADVDACRRRSRRRASACAHARPLDQRDLALGRPAAHQDRDALHAAASVTPPAGTPMRRISHSQRRRRTVSRTRRRTSSPRPSMSAAVALPVLIRKLQCFSETCAPPRREAAAAGRVDQLPGLAPLRRRRSGWRRSSRRCGCGSAGVASRAAGSRCMRAAIACGASRRARERRDEEDPVLGHARSGGRRSRARRGSSRCTRAARRRAPRRSTSDVRHLAAVGAGIHAQRAADRAGNAGEELEPGDAGVARAAARR